MRDGIKVSLDGRRLDLSGYCEVEVVVEGVPLPSDDRLYEVRYARTAEGRVIDVFGTEEGHVASAVSLTAVRGGSDEAAPPEVPAPEDLELASGPHQGPIYKHTPTGKSV